MDANREKYTAKRPGPSGQALIEMIFILPLIVVLMVWLLQGVEIVRASAEQQKYLRLDLFLRLNNHAQFAVDALGPSPGGEPKATALSNSKNAQLVEYRYGEYSEKSLAGTLEAFRLRAGPRVSVRSKLGICLRPECNY